MGCDKGVFTGQVSSHCERLLSRAVQFLGIFIFGADGAAFVSVLQPPADQTGAEQQQGCGQPHCQEWE